MDVLTDDRAAGEIRCVKTKVVERFFSREQKRPDPKLWEKVKQQSSQIPNEVVSSMVRGGEWWVGGRGGGGRLGLLVYQL